MNIQLIHGQFSNQEAIDLITQLVQVKIKFLENKILNTDSEEAIKMREKRIKTLQQELQQARAHIATNGSAMNVESTIQLL